MARNWDLLTSGSKNHRGRNITAKERKKKDFFSVKFENACSVLFFFRFHFPPNFYLLYEFQAVGAIFIFGRACAFCATPSATRRLAALAEEQHDGAQIQKEKTINVTGDTEFVTVERCPFPGTPGGGALSAGPCPPPPPCQVVKPEHPYACRRT